MPVGDYVSPAAGGGTFETYDQGIDWHGPPGTNIVTIGSAILDRVSLDAGGFGKAEYYHLTEGPGRGQEIYVGHAEPLLSPSSKVLPPGTPIARLVNPGLGPSGPGHTEVGFARSDASQPLYSGEGHGLDMPGGNAFAHALASWGIGNISGTSPFGPADTGSPSPSPGPQPPPGQPSPGATSGCASDNWNAGPCTGAMGKNPGAEGGPCCASGFGSAPDLPGTIQGGQCCGPGIGGSGNQTPSKGSGGNGCLCLSIPSIIPGIGGSSACLIPQPVCDFFGAITSTAFWIRAGEVILGLILLAIGLRMAASRAGMSVGVPNVAKAAAAAAV